MSTDPLLARPDDDAKGSELIIGHDLRPGERVRAAKKYERLKKQTNEEITKKKVIAYANYLNKLKALHIAYALCDSLSIWYSTLRYVCSLLSTETMSKSDLLLRTLTSKEGIICFAASAVCIMAIAVIGATAGKDSHVIQKKLAKLWPYIRETLKGAKNSYKAINNSLKIAMAMGSSNVKFLATPVGLLVGSIHILNSIYYRRICDWRKNAMATNKSLFQEVYDKTTLSQSGYQHYLKQIVYQSSGSRKRAFISASSSGVVNGLYYQMGILTISTIAPPMLIALIVMCAMMLIASVISRNYQEYCYQRKLQRSAIEVKLVLTTRRLNTVMTKLANALQKHKSKAEIEAINQQCLELREQLKQLQQDYKETLHISYREALIKGISDGAYAYSAISSFFFFITLILMLTNVAIPPAAILSIVLLGFFSIAAFTGYSFYQTYQQNKANEKSNQPQDSIADLHDDLQAEIKSRFPNSNIELITDSDSGSDEITSEQIQRMQLDEIQAEVIEEQLLGNLRNTLDENPQPSFQELFEVIRSLFSGLSKGEKPFDAYYTPDFDKDNKSQIILMWMTIGVSLVYALIYALRAFAKTFSQFHKNTPQHESNQREEIDSTSDIDESDSDDSDCDELDILTPSQPVQRPSFFQQVGSTVESKFNSAKNSLASFGGSFFRSEQSSTRANEKITSQKSANQAQETLLQAQVG